MAARFTVGDLVEPLPEWAGVVPGGRVERVEVFGTEGAVWVAGARCAFAGWAFRRQEVGDGAAPCSA